MQHILSFHSLFFSSLLFSFLFFSFCTLRDDDVAAAAASAHEQRIFVLVMPVMTATTTRAATATKQNMLLARLELGQLPQLSHESQPGASVSKFYLVADCDCDGDGDSDSDVSFVPRFFFSFLFFLSFVIYFKFLRGIKCNEKRVEKCSISKKYARDNYNDCKT